MPPALRRNGKPPSCEPCRSRKIRCDHSTPTCGRCARKNLRCVYEKAPMTRLFRQGRRSDAEVGRARSTRSSETFEVPAARVSGPVALQAVEVTASRNPAHGLLEMLRRRDQAGYVPAPSSVVTYTIQPDKLELGLQILDFIQEHTTLLHNLVHFVYSTIRMPMIPPKVQFAIADDLTATLAAAALPSAEAKLCTVVRIFQNSFRPLHTMPCTTADELCALVTGENLRWEVVAAVLVAGAMCLGHITDRELATVDLRGRGREDLVGPFREITDVVLGLVGLSPVPNEFTVCLKYHELLLAFQRFSESSTRLNAIFLELTSLSFATHIHHNISKPGPYPGFMGQWRRMCFVAVYAMDKATSTTLGRPPLLLRYHCVLDPPLDLDDGLDAADAAVEAARLDVRGWNRDGRRWAATFLRVQFLLATVREEVLELQAGVGGVHIPSRAQHALETLQSVWDNCPENMKYDPSLCSQPLHRFDMWFILSFYLDYQYTKFLIRRISPDEGHSLESLDMLIAAAKDVLSTVLVFNERREQLREVRADLSGIFMAYGLAPVELLLAELTSGSPSALAPWRHGRLRATVIRELTVYASCLSWVAVPGSGNFEFCTELQSRLTPLLDQLIHPLSDAGALLSSLDDAGGSVVGANGGTSSSSDGLVDRAAHLSHWCVFDWNSGGDAQGYFPTHSMM